MSRFTATMARVLLMSSLESTKSHTLRGLLGVLGRRGARRCTRRPAAPTAAAASAAGGARRVSDTTLRVRVSSSSVTISQDRAACLRISPILAALRREERWAQKETDISGWIRD